MYYPHHDSDNRLMNMNLGNTLSIWDRLFGSYTDEKVNTFGTIDIAPNDSSNFLKMLKLPFKK